LHNFFGYIQNIHTYPEQLADDCLTGASTGIVFTGCKYQDSNSYAPDMYCYL